MFHPELQEALQELKVAISKVSFEQKGKFPPSLKPILTQVAIKAIHCGEYNDNFFALMPKLFIYNKFTMTVRLPSPLALRSSPYSSSSSLSSTPLSPSSSSSWLSSASWLPPASTPHSSSLTYCIFGYQEKQGADARGTQKLIKRTVYPDHQKLLLARQDELLEELGKLADEGFPKAQEEFEKSVHAWGTSKYFYS